MTLDDIRNGLVVALVAAAASSVLPVSAADPGKAVWEGTCALCHTEPFSGAPQIGDVEAWAPRIAKGREALYASALDGFFGPMGDEMPARGGNDSLSDDEVRAAVDYMLAASGVN